MIFSSGLITDKTGNYTGALLFSAFSMWAGFVLMIGIYSLNEHKKAEEATVKLADSNAIAASQAMTQMQTPFGSIFGSNHLGVNGVTCNSNSAHVLPIMKSQPCLKPNKESFISLRYGSPHLKIDEADWKAVSYASLQSLHLH